MERPEKITDIDALFQSELDDLNEYIDYMESNSRLIKRFNHHVINKIRNRHTDAEVRRYLGNILK